MYFKNGLRDRELFRVLVRKDPRTCEELFEIANPYANAEEVFTESRGERRLGNREKGESSKSGDRGKKSDREVTNVERPRSPRPAHRVNPTEYVEFLERKCVIHPQGNHKMKDGFKIDSLATELMNAKKKEGSSKKPVDHGGSFQKAC